MNSHDFLSVDDAIQSRYAARAYLDKPVDLEIIKNILTVAARAPSGTNTQPWKIYVISGQKRDELVNEVSHLQEKIFYDPSLIEDFQESYAYYPKIWKAPYLDRRQENGAWLYGLLNISRNDTAKMQKQLLKNYEFFGAPIGIFFTVDRSLGIGSKMDIAMMMQNVMLCAKSRGLDTCPQAAWNKFHTVVLKHLKAHENEELVCGMALGYADHDHIINSSKTSRIELDEFATFIN